MRLRMRKRFTSLLLVLVMLMSFFPFSAFAQEDEAVGGDAAVELVSTDGESGGEEVPEVSQERKAILRTAPTRAARRVILIPIVSAAKTPTARSTPTTPVARASASRSAAIPSALRCRRRALPSRKGRARNF